MINGKSTYAMAHAFVHPLYQHMFHASICLLYFITQWSWDSLPKELTESVYMTLDTPICMDDAMSSNDTDIIMQEYAEKSQAIPVHKELRSTGCKNKLKKYWVDAGFLHS